MKKQLRAINRAIGVRTGWQLTREAGERRRYPIDFENWLIEICDHVRPFTMVTPERIDSVCRAIDYVHDARVPGDFVECGVWRGGCTMAAALRLLQRGENERNLWLYDTFEGMPPGDDIDVDPYGNQANDRRSAMLEIDGEWAAASLEEVHKAMHTTHYPRSRIHYVEGMVEDTIPANVPKQISVLRLDTDFYVSTQHELKHLVPLMAPRSVLIVDDYGHWAGAKKAVDEYFADRPVLLNRTDYSGRMALMVGPSQ